jgi:flagellar FliJ protein
MKKFNFKLEPLLNYRKYLERLAQQKTAKANMDVKMSEKQIYNLDRTKTRNAQNIENIVSKGVSSTIFRQYYQYHESVESSIKEEKLRKIELDKVLKKKLVVLKKKSVDKKAMELYREKLKDLYTQEMVKNEQKEQDEMSSLKTARTLSNETI